MPLLLLILGGLAWGSPTLKTTAEISSYQSTGRYEEVVHLCRGLVARYSKRVACETFGVSPEGRNLHYLVVSDGGALTPKLARLKRNPVVFFQAGIHPGEIDGKDAGFAFLRDVLDGKILKGVLKNVTLVFIPVLNVDGHERFGPNQRPNQNGPAETGWRTTAHNLNLNRDYMKAESPEMRDILKLLRYWDPEIYLDLHVTDGAKFQHDVAILVRPKDQGPDKLKSLGHGISEAILKKLTTLGHLPLDFYPSFREEDNPLSGFERGIPPPRFSDAYWATANRIGVLVETHSWRDYRHRVQTTYDVLQAFVELAALEGRDWRAIENQLDGESIKGQPVALSYDRGKRVREIEFKGYKYQRRDSEVSGTHRIQYDDSLPETWKVPLYEGESPELVVTAPVGGYLIPEIYADKVIPKLQIHGLNYRVIKKATTSRPVEQFKAETFHFAKESFEGRQRLDQKGKWQMSSRAVEKGALFVPIEQPKARLVMHLLEPEAPDSLASWGFFNSHYEKKEYLEAYLAEDFAAKLMKSDPGVKKEFESWLKASPEIAKDPHARLEFFARRHPSWDPRYGVYPIVRTAETF